MNQRLRPDGKFLLAADGKAAVGPACECSTCEKCCGFQNSAVVTVDGGADPDCLSYAGTYLYVIQNTIEWGCIWSWTRSADPARSLEVEYHKTFDKWSVGLYFDDPSIFPQFWNPDVSGLSCVNGKLTGAFDLPGVDGIDDCIGYTAHVTL